MKSAECRMRNEDLKERTKNFALQIIRLVENLPENRTAHVFGRQILRSGTSVGANYRAACRAKSRADFISKMSIVEEEADEALYWLELMLDTKLVEKDKIRHLMKEADEIIAIMVTSIKTARDGQK